MLPASTPAPAPCAGDITSADYQKLLATLPELYAAGDLSTFGLRVMRTVSQLIPADTWAYEECNPYLGRAIGNVYPTEFQSFVKPAEIVRFGELLPTHPVFRHWIERGAIDHPATPAADGAASGCPRPSVGALTISDFVSCVELENSALYADVYRGYGIRDQLCLLIDFPKPIMVAVGCDRNSRTFSTRDRQMLELLHPHLVAAYQNASAVTRLQGAGPSPARAASPPAPRTGVLALNGDYEMIGNTGEAGTLLAEYFGRVARTVLPSTLHHRLRRMQRDAAATRMWTQRGPKGSLVIRALHQPPVHHLTLLLEELPHDSGPQSNHAPVGSLPPRLRQTLDHLLAGKSIKEIAADLGISRHTADEHVRRLYAHFDVSSRGQLLALFVKTPAAVAPASRQ